MTVFDVFVNDRRICRAGVGADGVLNAIVSWVRLTGEAARQAKALRAPLEELRLHVGGLRGSTHRRWQVPDVKVGDRISIVIAAAARFDAPDERIKRDLRKQPPPKRKIRKSTP